MKASILAVSLVFSVLLTGCANTGSRDNYTPVLYTENDNYKSNRVDYLGYGLGGHGFGGYSMGGYGIAGYAGQVPGS